MREKQCSKELLEAAAAYFRLLKTPNAAAADILAAEKRLNLIAKAEGHSQETEAERRLRLIAPLPDEN